MRIALVTREFPPASQSHDAERFAALAESLLREGHLVHLVTQATSRAPHIEADGRLIVHRIPLPAPAVGWGRVVLDFSTLAARLCADLAARGAIDGVEFAPGEGAGAALAVYRTLGGAAPLCALASGETSDASPASGFAASIAAAFTHDEALHPDARSERLELWRRIQSAAATMEPAA